ncbi:AraC family transcriptional regulator [Bailinhaonella thermotolerans]|uniref:AraC family transcriptional regulator n=1 Tax=Bailinhaonella thermotolerans TaxID=1070861 RepID=A0A3A4BIZ9_9ACTN|nr:AraC family transcriptional regulator [Bailinhaonella thermotolerans]RJL31222.1 AraC family transcriptional regulator [Bailinhaonella thermotolerans]
MADSARYWRHPGVPGVDLLRARYVTQVFGRHTHDTFAIGFIESGVEEFAYRGTTHRAPQGSVVLVMPDQVHTGHAGTPDGWRYRMLYPSVELIASIAGTRGVPYFPDAVAHDPATALLLGSAHRAAEVGDRLAASTLVRGAFAELLRRHSAHPPPAEARRPGSRAVRLARELLHERLVAPPSLEELASSVGARPFPLLRAFKAVTGLPPHAYLNQLRVRRARELLDAGLPPARVAAEVGFADQAHLTRHFKRALGVPPGAYQRNIVQDGLSGRP